jgi:hypothetical protein
VSVRTTSLPRKALCCRWFGAGVLRELGCSAGEVYVNDGDTFTVRGQQYRLIGFDTPEIRSYRKMPTGTRIGGASYFAIAPVGCPRWTTAAARSVFVSSWRRRVIPLQLRAMVRNADSRGARRWADPDQRRSSVLLRVRAHIVPAAAGLVLTGLTPPCLPLVGAVVLRLF